MSWCVFDVAKQEREIAELEAESAEADFWKGQERAQGVMRRLGELRGEVEKWRGMERKVAELLELSELSEDDEETSLQEEIIAETEKLATQFEQMEFELLLLSILTYLG